MEQTQGQGYVTWVRPTLFCYSIDMVGQLVMMFVLRLVMQMANECDICFCLELTDIKLTDVLSWHLSGL
jgi:hypothetical protein